MIIFFHWKILFICLLTKNIIERTQSNAIFLFKKKKFSFAVTTQYAFAETTQYAFTVHVSSLNPLNAGLNFDVTFCRMRVTPYRSLESNEVN